MKKLISGLSALALAVAIAPMSAFADTTKVTFDAPRISPEYIITIPATADLNAETPTATITAENVYLDTTKHKQINVTLDSAQYVSKGDSTFVAKTEDGSSSVTYTIGKGTATTGVKVGDVVAEFTNNPDEAANPDVQTATLSFSEPTGATYAGRHTETLTFGIEVEKAAKYNVQVSATYNGDGVFEGEPNQIGLTGAMEPVTVRIPEDLKSICKFNRFDDVVQNGITKHWVDDYTVTVSGTPTADTNVFVKFDLITG